MSNQEYQEGMGAVMDAFTSYKAAGGSMIAVDWFAQQYRGSRLFEEWRLRWLRWK